MFTLALFVCLHLHMYDQVLFPPLTRWTFVGCSQNCNADGSEDLGADVVILQQLLDDPSAQNLAPNVGATQQVGAATAGFGAMSLGGERESEAALQQRIDEAKRKSDVGAVVAAMKQHAGHAGVQ